MTRLPISLYPGVRVAQLVFEMLSTPADRPYGHGGLGSQIPGPVRTHAEPVLAQLRGRHRTLEYLTRRPRNPASQEPGEPGTRRARNREGSWRIPAQNDRTRVEAARPPRVFVRHGGRPPRRPGRPRNHKGGRPDPGAKRSNPVGRGATGHAAPHPRLVARNGAATPARKLRTPGMSEAHRGRSPAVDPGPEASIAPPRPRPPGGEFSVTTLPIRGVVS